jgi:phosphoserine phosphatase
MKGEIPLATVYGERLNLVSPSKRDIEDLASEYVARIQPDARESLAKLTNARVRVVLVSAGIKEAILPLAREVGVGLNDVNAVSVQFDAGGEYAGFDSSSPLTRNGGKAEVVRLLGLPHPILGVGDGITDLELRIESPLAVDAFAAYIGVVERGEVSAKADYIVRSFPEVVDLVLQIDRLTD